MSRKILFVLGGALVLIAAALLAWDANTPASVSAQEGEKDCGVDPCPAWIVTAWAASPHNDKEAEAFIHWNEDDPKEVPVDCARCHSTPGYVDYLGDDGSAAGAVDLAAPVGTTVSCEACHSPSAVSLTSVSFPSGAVLSSGLEDSARCMVCHQGRESGASVAARTEGMDLDTPNPDLRFVNIHYFPAAASRYGSEVQGGFQYEGQSYQGEFRHVPAYDTCAECHNPHTLELKVNECAVCHTNVASVEDLKSVRMNGSKVDYDGDGDLAEGIYGELEGMQALLYQAIQAYASEVAGLPLVYDAASYPYFFADANANGAVDEGEEAFNAFTPRLLQAAYNFQMYEKDPGAFAHNAKYHVQLMHDSIVSLNEMIAAPIDLSAAHRNDAGHFNGTEEAFRHWDEDGEVSASCAKCHSAEGLPTFLKYGTTIGYEPSDGLACSTCHIVEEGFALYQVTDVRFPSGATLSFGENLPANLCINCHQGRESTVSVNNAIAGAGVGDDEVSDALTFRNIHYFAAGATLFGGDAKGGYQYDGKEYVGRFAHVPGFDTCVACHDVHALTVQVDKCAQCHGQFEDVTAIRMMAGDWDGDGDTAEGVAGEIDTMREALLAAILNYATNTAGTAIAYNEDAFPYWFIDANGNGVADPEETERYATWTPALLRATYNYQYSLKDPGAFAHNGKYTAELLYDSLEAIGGADAVAGWTRP